MSLLYIIDAYNLTNHPRFKPVNRAVNIQQSLADFIRINRLSGSKNNRVILVFDGYPPPGQDLLPQGDGLICMFSRKIEADELIKKIVEESASARNITVVSDDKQVQLASRLLRARVSGVEEFICGKKNKAVSIAGVDSTGPKLTYSAMQKINAELKKKWLD